MKIPTTVVYVFFRVAVETIGAGKENVFIYK